MGYEIGDGTAQIMKLIIARGKQAGVSGAERGDADLDGQTVIVTGGGGGIGGRRVGAKAEGARVAVCDIDGAAAAATATAITDAGGSAEAVTLDITDYDAVTKAVAAVEAALGPVGGLVNSAGWDRFQPQNHPDWQQVISSTWWGP